MSYLYQPPDRPTDGPMQATKGTDIGDWVQKLIGKDMTELKAGMAVLRAADLRVAASELRTLLRTIRTILGMQDEKKRSSELEIFQRKAETVIGHAQEAFEKVETPEEKIRAVEIAVIAITASNPCREASVLRDELVEELEKILNEERVLNDARLVGAPRVTRREVARREGAAAGAGAGRAHDYSPLRGLRGDEQAQTRAAAGGSGDGAAAPELRPAALPRPRPAPLRRLLRRDGSSGLARAATGAGVVVAGNSGHH